MLYTLWYLDNAMNGVTERDDASALEVYDLKGSTGGQMSIDEFNLEELPMTIDDEGFDVWDLNTYLKKDAVETEKPTKAVEAAGDWRATTKSWKP